MAMQTLTDHRKGSFNAKFRAETDEPFFGAQSGGLIRRF